MYIDRISVQNFRILKDSTLDFKDKLCMMIGRNNCGKTSFLVLFEKFYNNYSFDYNDFSIALRSKINTIDESTDIHELSIRMIISIVYEENDDLTNISEFIMDLDPTCSTVKLVFECTIKKDKLLSAISTCGEVGKEKYIQKYLQQFLETKIYIFENLADLKSTNRHKLIKKELCDVKKIIDFDIIHAKRSVSSSDEKTSKKILSSITTKYFNENNTNSPDKFEPINKLISDMDQQLAESYKSFFTSFLKNSADFLRLEGLKVVSNLRSTEIVNDSSEVIYGEDDCYLPEYLNGLGYMNILYLLLTIEIKKTHFLADNKDIKLLFIEEPEAHTHPQLQYIFARKIYDIFGDINGLQAIITTHSPHIVSNSKFEDIRYLSKIVYEDKSENIEIKNFHRELSLKYTKEEEFKFLKQYLSIESAELFFASKAIFIEGTSENMLMPYFISNFDQRNISQEKARKCAGEVIEKEYQPLSSQNVTILQVGANAKVFRHFLEFLDIKTLVITDIDTTKLSSTNRYSACAVENVPESTSNETIKYYFNAPDFNETGQFSTWLKDIIEIRGNCISDKICVMYQKPENGYHARSFEDAFINVNLATIKKNIEDIRGLKKKDSFDTIDNIYDLTQDILDKKSDFSSSILYLAHTDESVIWKTPLYIEEGLAWIQK
jgi:predicted ATP-dependent endonuclease of OLD family